MIYVTSDLHGYPLDGFLQLLDSVNFSDEDFLFVLGDVIDRGDQGIALLRWMAEQPNVQLILGNHEAMLLGCQFLFREISQDALSAISQEDMAVYSNWMYNGGNPTLTWLRKLLKEEPDIFEGILSLLRDAPLYDSVTLNGKHYILVHSGFDNFSPDKPLHRYEDHELLWARPTLQTRYFDGATVVFGHTPTEFLDPEQKGRAVRAEGWICIDTGVAAGGKPMLLRLDDEKEFYL